MWKPSTRARRVYLAYASRIRMPGRKVLSAAISECRPAMGPRPSLLNREQNMFPRLLAVVFLLVEVLGLSRTGRPQD
jgi:hypothetical protein